jgi:hypothetical protein
VSPVRPLFEKSLEAGDLEDVDLEIKIDILGQAQANNEQNFQSENLTNPGELADKDRAFTSICHLQEGFGVFDSVVHEVRKWLGSERAPWCQWWCALSLFS